VTYPQPDQNQSQQSWGSPPQQQWQDTPQPTGFITSDVPPHKASRKPLIVAVLATVGVFVVGGVGYGVWDGFIREDTGVAACKAIRDGKQMDGSPKGSSDDKMTEAEYREMREIFEDSRHDKLREHGTGLVDVVWQAQGLGDGAGLALIGPMGAHMSGLQSACADQGVIVDLSAD
jgi:hypothetical protein